MILFLTRILGTIFLSVLILEAFLKSSVLGAAGEGQARSASFLEVLEERGTASTQMPDPLSIPAVGAVIVKHRTLRALTWFMNFPFLLKRFFKLQKKSFHIRQTAGPKKYP